MNIRRLRRLIAQYDKIGVLVVGLYLFWRSRSRPMRLTMACLMFLLALIAASWIDSAHKSIPAFVVKNGASPLVKHVRIPEGKMAENQETFGVSDIYVSRDGNAVAAIAGSTPGQLWSLDPMTGKVFLCNQDPRIRYRVSWNKGGQQLAFTGDNFIIKAPPYAAPLFIADVRRRQVRTIVTPSDAWYVKAMAWSLDGKRLAYLRAPRPARLESPPSDSSSSFAQESGDSGLGVWIVSIDGKEHFHIPLSTDIKDLQQIWWNPNGSHLYLITGVWGTNQSHLWLISLDGKAKEMPVPIGAYVNRIYVPRLGTHIAIHTSDETKNGAFRLWLCNPEGENRIDMGEFDQLGRVDWSPDGEWLAFADRPPAEGDNTVRICHKDGTDLKKYIAGRGILYDTSDVWWSPNGDLVCVESHHSPAHIINPRTGSNTEMKYGPTYGIDGWRSDGMLIGTGLVKGSRRVIAVLRQDGSIERIFPPEIFTNH